MANAMKVCSFIALGAVLSMAACGDDEGSGGSGGSGTTTATTTSSSSSTGSTTVSSTSTTGVGGQGGAGGHDPDLEVEEHACEHLEEGPFVPLDAAADAATAPLLANTHVAYEVTLQEAGGGQHDGFLAYEAAEAAEFFFFLDADVPVAFSDEQGNPLTVEATCDSQPCSEVCTLIKKKYKLDLEIGRAVLSFGPTPTHDLLVLVEEAHHDH